MYKLYITAMVIGFIMHDVNKSKGILLNNGFGVWPAI